MSSRQWDNYADWLEEKSRDLRRDSSQKYYREGHEYRSKEHRKDPSGRDRKRSTERRRASSPDREALDKKWLAEEKNYRYRRESVGGKQSLETYRDTDLRYRRTSPDSRHAYRHHDATSKQQQGSDPTYRRLTDGHRGGDRSYDYPVNHSAKRNVKPRERSNSPSAATFREDRPKDRCKYGQNGSDKQSFPSDVSFSHRASVPQESSSKGFERFLDVLNKGVNVNLLTKIVTQTPTGAEAPPPPSPVISSSRAPCHPSSGSRAETVACDPHRPVSPQLRLNRFRPPDEEPPPRSYSRSRSNSPSNQAETVLTPEEEHKRRQMQDVLQAIGVDLGLEELGQMSHRIQERLYGRRDSNPGRKPSRESSTWRERSPPPRSRSSSSSRSRFTPLPPDSYGKQRRSHSNQREEPEQDRHHQSDPETSEHPSFKCDPETSGGGGGSLWSKASHFTPPPFLWNPSATTQWNPAPVSSPSILPNWSSPLVTPPVPQWSPAPPAAVSKPPAPAPLIPPYSPMLYPPPLPPPRFYPPPPPPLGSLPQIQPYSNAFSAARPLFSQTVTKPKGQPRNRCLHEIHIKKY
ncbi:pollen-specific leucine-rich repeat extensin-like protein 1 isoform X2 [Gouania willdenowi]|uniref:pollen-specific leucine-rich repeat extensin-like protein 1 isoform X2 n=1 Tax=Gouania willdenowi TaxID=441366 RepID=UPI0010563AD7|nr:pollen-specific leucine-rich repeat extensin-like protein 1 isoform X2 [Gouania willdenowi]